MLAKAVEKIGLPVMVKGCFYKAFRAYTIQEATAHFNKLVAEWGYPVIVQEVVTGDELNVVGTGRRRGKFPGTGGIKKIWITSLGKMWTGVTIRNQRMLEAAEKFIRVLLVARPFRTGVHRLGRQSVFNRDQSPVSRHGFTLPREWG